MAGGSYERFLTRADLTLLAAASGEPVEQLRGDPALVEAVLASPAAYRSLFSDPPHETRWDPGDPPHETHGFRRDPGESAQHRDPLLVASPFLVFSVLVGRVAGDLEQAAFVDEWLAPGRTVPVFDVVSLRELLAAPGHRVFLAELLASYTRVTSGVVWQRTPRGWRRRRYSDLDPVRLAGLLEVVPPEQRVVVCRRLGDLALFLSGVFPEHAASHPLQPRQIDRIRRLLDSTGLGAPVPVPEEAALASGPRRGVWLLEWLGRRSYRLAERGGGADGSELRPFIAGFGRARRVLNLLTQRYLFPTRERWFPPTGD